MKYYLKKLCCFRQIEKSATDTINQTNDLLNLRLSFGQLTENIISLKRYYLRPSGSYRAAANDMSAKFATSPPHQRKQTTKAIQSTSKKTKRPTRALIKEYKEWWASHKKIEPAPNRMYLLTKNEILWSEEIKPNP
jgi:hypothetical protein